MKFEEENEMDEAKIEEKVEKGLKKMHKVVQFFSRLVEGEDDPLVRLALKLALAEEIADVRIMLEQMTFFYGISRRRVTMDIKRKVQRQLERIKAESKCEYVV